MKRACLAGVAALAIVLPGLGGSAFGQPAFGQVAFPDASFSGYSSGTALHLDAAQFSPAGPRVEDTEVAFAGATVNSKGLAQVLNEFEQAVVPQALANARAYGRGDGLEVGLGTVQPNDPNANQIKAAEVAEAAAPPSPALVRKETGPVSASPAAYASLVRGEAQPVYSDNVCVLGQPISYGLGYAADAQLVSSGGPGPDGSFAQPVVAADAGTPTDRTASQSKSYTYLKPNSDGTFGLVTETRQIIAPVTLFKGNPAAQLTIEVLGEWVLRATATGKPGGSKIDYAPDGDPSPSTPVLRLTPAVGTPTELTFQQVFGNGGFSLPGNPLVGLAIGENVRAIANTGQAADFASAPTLAANGTEAAGAVDVVRVNVLATAGADTPRISDLRLGHMESRAKVPEGGIRCVLPVSKTTSADLVLPGELFSWTVKIPKAANALDDAIACDLVEVTAVDNATSESGVKFKMLSASNGGVVSADGKKVTWPNLGTYKPGSPPITVTIQGQVEPDSLAGVITNVVEATANLGNCTGGAGSQQLTGLAQIVNNAGLAGAARVVAKTGAIAAAAQTVTPRTGDNTLVRSLAGLGLVGLALFGRRAVRPRG